MCKIHKNYCKYVRFLKEVDIIILTDSFFFQNQLNICFSIYTVYKQLLMQIFTKQYIIIVLLHKNACASFSMLKRQHLHLFVFFVQYLYGPNIVTYQECREQKVMCCHTGAGQAFGICTEGQWHRTRIGDVQNTSKDLAWDDITKVQHIVWKQDPGERGGTDVQSIATLQRTVSSFTSFF